jgi:hypothetical protein
MDAEQNSRAVRVGGELLVLHCWACGTAHSVNMESCNPGELSNMVCSNNKCRMSMFLVNELAIDDKAREQMARQELKERTTHSRFWK